MQVLQAGQHKFILLELDTEIVTNVAKQAGFDIKIRDGSRSLSMELTAASRQGPLLLFEAADPAVFTWYVKNYGPTVNLFVDHSQIVQLECLRSGIWGTADTWGRIVTLPG